MDLLSHAFACLSPPSTPTKDLQFFENLNPLNGFKDDNEFSDFHYNLSQKLEPKDGEPYQGKPKYPLEALKSPGIKIHHAKTPSTPKSAPSAIKSPKSPSTLAADSSRQHSPDESHFGIIDINPGHLPKYIGDSGRINPAFSGDTPLQTPTGLIRRTPSGRRPPASPLSTASYPESNHFSFPPQLKFPTSHSNHSMGSGSSGVFPTSMAPGAIVLDKPPAGRGIHKPPPPPPSGTMTRKKPPPPPPCEPSCKYIYVTCGI
uniref:Uncharacterized protein n=1 Tax=Panagrolaimus davidi TaxID=227884 RepID=A0A914Q8P5_9BILA